MLRKTADCLKCLKKCLNCLRVSLAIKASRLQSYRMQQQVEEQQQEEEEEQQQQEHVTSSPSHHPPSLKTAENYSTDAFPLMAPPSTST